MPITNGTDQLLIQKITAAMFLEQCSISSSQTSWYLTFLLPTTWEKLLWKYWRKFQQLDMGQLSNIHRVRPGPRLKAALGTPVYVFHGPGSSKMISMLLCEISAVTLIQW